MMKARFFMLLAVTGIFVLGCAGLKSSVTKKAEAYNNQGIAYHKKGDYDQAIREYTKAIEISPRYAEAHNNLGTAYYEKGNYDQAIREYTKAIAINPGFAQAYNNRGFAYDRKGDYDQAILNLLRACELGGEHACRELENLRPH